MINSLLIFSSVYIKIMNDRLFLFPLSENPIGKLFFIIIKDDNNIIIS